jgi:hypothetical protein
MNENDFFVEKYKKNNEEKRTVSRMDPWPAAAAPGHKEKSRAIVEFLIVRISPKGESFQFSLVEV